MTKRIISILLIFCMLITAMPLALATETAVAVSSASGYCNESIYWELSSDGVLTVTGEGTLPAPVADSSATATHFSAYSDSIREIILCDGITAIEDYAIYEFYNLESISLPSTLTSIGEGFLKGSLISNVEIPATVQTFHADWSFVKCNMLENITFYNPDIEILMDNCEQLPSVGTVWGYTGSMAEEYASLCGLSFYALGETAVGYQLNVDYDSDLCNVTMTDWYTGASIDNGGFICEDAKEGRAYCAIEISDIAEGYRIKDFIVNGTSYAEGMIHGAYGGMAITITADTYFEVQLEEIPETLAAIQSAGVYTDKALTEPAQAYVTMNENTRLYASAVYDGDYPLYYSGCYWEYSLDGTTWTECTEWGNRVDFWAGWSNHDFDFVNTDNYYMRAHLFGKENYSEGDCYTDIIKVNHQTASSGSSGGGSSSEINGISGTLSFAEGAYLKDGTLTAEISCYTKGATYGYAYQEIEISEIKDYSFNIPWESGVTQAEVNVVFFGKADTNIYLDETFVYTADGLVSQKTTGYSNYLALDYYTDVLDLTMPCGSVITGKIETEGYQAVDQLYATLLFNDEYYTRAWFDEDLNYTAVLPSDLPDGDGDYTVKLEICSENAVSNLVQGMYYAGLDASSAAAPSYTINPENSISEVNFSIPTGYAVGGVVQLPEDAQTENYGYSVRLGIGDYDAYASGLDTRPDLTAENPEVSFMVGIPKTDTVTTATIYTEVYGGMYDDSEDADWYSNIYEGRYYYVDNTTTAFNETDATSISVNCDMTDLVITLQPGTVFETYFEKPEWMSGLALEGDLYLLTEDNEQLAEQWLYMSEDVDSSRKLFVLSPEVAGKQAYLMYKLDYGIAIEYPDIYTGKAYVNPDGTIVPFRSDAELYTLGESDGSDFVLISTEEAELPETVTYDGTALESAHPYASYSSYDHAYYYEGEGTASQLAVTFSPLSHLDAFSDAQITICDGSSQMTTYTYEEFNQKVAGETLLLDGYKFTISMSNNYVYTSDRDYGFAIVNIEPIDNTTALHVIDTDGAPVSDAKIIIYGNDGYENLVYTDANGYAYSELPNGVYNIEVRWGDYQYFTIEVTDTMREFEFTVETTETTPGGSGGSGGGGYHAEFHVMDAVDLSDIANATLWMTLSSATGEDTEAGESASTENATAEAELMTDAMDDVELGATAPGIGETFITYSAITDENGYAYFELSEAGTYNLTVQAEGYNEENLTVTIDEENSTLDIYLSGTQVSPDEPAEDAITFSVQDSASLQEIANAKILVCDEAQTVCAELTTDSDGSAWAELENGVYSVQAFADGYQLRSFVLEITETNRAFTIYLSEDSILQVDTTVTEMDYNDILHAGIDPDAVENKQVYNCTAVLQFSPTESVSIDYICTDDEILKGEPVKFSNKVIYPTAKDIYLIIHSNTTWLKEMFDVQLLVSNTSAIETVEDCIATLNLPDGLSLAAMTDGTQTAEALLGDIAPGGSADLHWYISGDAEGEYLLNGTVTGLRTGGGITEDMAVSFATKEPVVVLGGSAMKLTITAERTATVGEPYRVEYRLTNESNKTLYNVALQILGGKFVNSYGVSDLKYSSQDNLSGSLLEGYMLSKDAFYPGDALYGIFEITFAEGIETDALTYMLTDMFCITGSGSTVTIPTEIVFTDEITMHHFDNGTVLKDATCTEDGTIEYRCTDAGCEETRSETIPATGHNWSAWTAQKAVTCTTDGVNYRSCSLCDAEETQTITAPGHNYETGWTVDIAATCTESGEKSHHCTRCDGRLNITETPALNHDMGAWVTTKEPTCTEEGTKARYCSRCTYLETEALPITHAWDAGSVTVAPTEDSEGERTHTCPNCGDTKTEPMAKLQSQDVYFIVGDITLTYGDRRYVYNTAYNDSENGGALTYFSSDENVATVNEDGRVTILNTGTTVITATAAAVEHQYLETTVSYTLTVEKAPLILTPVATTITYGDLPAHNEFSAEGLVYEETRSVLTGRAKYTFDYKQYMNCGTYQIFMTGLEAKNYEITFNPGILTVEKNQSYRIVLGNLTQRKGSVAAVTAAITPEDATAVISVEYQLTDGSWVTEVPAEMGVYPVRAALTASENLIVSAPPVYTTATLTVKAGAMILMDGSSGIDIEIDNTTDSVEVLVSDDTLDEVLDNIPSTGEVVIDVTGNGDSKDLILPSNLVNALNESDSASDITVIADDAEISIGAEALKTVAQTMGTEDKVSISIDAVDSTSLNEKQQAALDAITKNAVVLELNMVVSRYDTEGNKLQEEKLHDFNGRVNVRAAYSLPEGMNEKRVIVCYVSDNGAVTYIRADYKDGYVSFVTDHFSHFAIVPAEISYSMTQDDNYWYFNDITATGVVNAPASAIAYVGLYDKNDILIAVDRMTFALNEPVDLKLPKTSNAIYARIFVWNADTMASLAPAKKESNL